MNTGTHEAIILSEVLRSNASMIDHYNMYLNSCQDQQLRSLLDRQQRHTLDSFQRLTQMMQSHGMDTSNIPLPATMSMTSSSMSTTVSASSPYGSQWSTPQYSSTQASAMPYSMQQSSIGSQGMGMGMSMPSQSMGMQTGSQSSSTSIFNDRSITEGALQFHKYGADATTRAALESSEPHIRAALTNMARNCIEMSYEIYGYMSQRGWYQLPNSPQNFVSHSTTQQQQYTNQ